MSHQRTTRMLNTQDYKTLSLSAFGGALEFYDFIIFVFFSKVIGSLFFPADMPCGSASFKRLASLRQAISHALLVGLLWHILAIYWVENACLPLAFFLWLFPHF